MQTVCAKSSAGLRVRVARQTSVKCNATGRRELLGLGALVAGFAVVSNPAMAGLTEDLLAKSEANKALNNKKRLATSSANVARSRTVADGTCKFPNNLFGCDNGSEAINGGVKYIADDIAIECQGKEPGKCASRVSGVKL